MVTILYRILPHLAIAALTFAATTVYDRYKFLRSQQALMVAHQRLVVEHRALQKEIRANWQALKKAVQK